MYAIRSYYDSFGIIGGRMKFWVRGESVADFFASADGGLFLLMTEGRLDNLLKKHGGGLKRVV